MSQLAEFTGNHPFLVMSFLIAAFLFFWTVLKEQSSQLKTISTDQLTRLVNQQNAVLVDTRSAEQFQAGHIVNAVNIPANEIDQATKKLPKGKKKTGGGLLSGGADIHEGLSTTGKTRF
jgi:hypothetical protein